MPDASRHGLQETPRRDAVLDMVKRRGLLDGPNMNDGLSLAQISLLIGYAAAMTGGQLLFKVAALGAAATASPGERLFAMLVNRFFLAAVLLYAALAVL